MVVLVLRMIGVGPLGALRMGSVKVLQMWMLWVRWMQVHQRWWHRDG